jgi:hypothetical protein
MKIQSSNLFILFIPWILSIIFSDNSIVSYGFAWSGHWLVFYMTLTGKILPLDGVKIQSRVMQPIVINQLIFAGFSGISTLFYFLSINGYYYYEPIENFLPDLDLVSNASECQQFYLLGHIGLVFGIVAGKQKEEPSEWRVITGKSPSFFLLFISGIAFVLYFILRSISGLVQVAIMFEALNLVASILALAFAIKEKRTISLLIALLLFGINISSALLSGWKEQLFIPFLLLGFFLYQSYPRVVLFTAPIIGVLYFTYIPTFNQVFRNMSWGQGEESDIAFQVALNSTLTAETEDIGSNNWTFLTNRLSEVNMLIKYKEFVPSFHSYYGFDIVQQSIMNLVPRLFYKDKPLTEALVMQRVFDSGVISNVSNVSAKPAFIADCYLSGGTFGVFLGTFVLGYFISFASNFAFKLFGGYTFGVALMYNSIFNELWRGNCFEFMATTMFWGLIVLFVIHRASRYGGIIVRSSPEIEEPRL